jgi:hypothetical protein
VVRPEWHFDENCAAAARGAGTRVEAIPFYTAVLSQLNAKRTELLKRLYLAEQKIEDEAALVVTTDREALLANDDRLDAYGEEAGNAQIVAAAVGADVIYGSTRRRGRRRKLIFFIF